MKALILIAAMLTTSAQAFGIKDLCDTTTTGAHLMTRHAANFRHDLRDVNPGLYAACDSIAAGVFANSVGRVSVYAAKQFYATPKLTLIVGGITGYKASPLMPMAMLSYKLDDGYRLSFFPSTKQNVGGLHLSKDF